MPKQVPIEVFRIGHTVVDREEVARWMAHLGANEFVIPDDEVVTNPALLIALAGKRCYMSFQKGLNPNINRIREDYTAYFDNIMASGHGSVLEHSVYNFAIEGVSRIFTGEMNRHRAGWAISEGSMRFIRYGESIPYWEPDSIKDDGSIRPEDMAEAIAHCQEAVTSALCALDHDPTTTAADLAEQFFVDLPLGFKKLYSRHLFEESFAAQERDYRVLEAIWADELAPDSKFADKKHVTSMMRRIVGMGVATGGVWSGNIRALRHVFTMRCSPAAEEEILHVFTRVVKVMAEKEPLLFGDFHQNEQGYWCPRFVKV